MKWWSLITLLWYSKMRVSNVMWIMIRPKDRRSTRTIVWGQSDYKTNCAGTPNGQHVLLLQWAVSEFSALLKFFWFALLTTWRRQEGDKWGSYGNKDHLILQKPEYSLYILKIYNKLGFHMILFIRVSTRWKGEGEYTGSMLKTFAL